MLGLEATGGVHQHELGALGLGRADGVVDHGSGIGIGARVGDHRHAAALPPDLHLLHGGGPEGVGRGDQAAVAAAHRQVGQLAEGGGLADAVDPHHQPDVEPLPLGGEQGNATGGDRFVQQATQLLLEEPDAFGRVHRLLVEALPQGLEHLIGGLHAHIGAQQGGFEVVEHLGGERIVAEAIEQLGDEAAPGLLKAAAQTTQPVDLLQGDVVELAALGGRTSATR